MRKGELNEARLSEYYHKTSLPLLVSSIYLREKNLGQVDICFIKDEMKEKKVLIIIEVKSKSGISQKQLKRLRESSNHLSQVLEISVQFKVNFCQKDDHSLFF